MTRIGQTDPELRLSGLVNAPVSIQLLVAALLLSAGAPSPLRADDCAAIRHADRRAHCLGRTRTSSACETIRDLDRRAACRAERRR